MSTGRHLFKMSSVQRVLRAAKIEGVPVRVEIDPKTGKLVAEMINNTGAAPQLDSGGEVNEWDEAYGTQPTEVRERDSKQTKRK